MSNFDDLFAPDPQGSTIENASDPAPRVSTDLDSSTHTEIFAPDPSPPWESRSAGSTGSEDPYPPAQPQRRGGIIEQIVTGVVEQLRPLLEQHPQQPPDHLTPPEGVLSEAPESQVNQLQAQLDLMQLRQEKLHRQVVNYEAEIDQLHKEKRLLEQTIAELPEIYQLKFQARLEPIRHRIQQIQAENQHLRTEVYELSYQLHHQYDQHTPHRWPLHLPQFTRREQKPLTALPKAMGEYDLTSAGE